MTTPPISSREWLEADGLGGFASGTATGIRTRRYHALLLTAITPPTGRMVLVNGFDAWIETPKGRFALTSQRYAPDVIHPDGAQRIEDFSVEPWPRWLFKFEDGTELTQEIFVAGEAGVTALTWRLTREAKNVRLCVRPLLSGRDYHGLHKENGAFRCDPAPNGEKVLWRPYDGLPGIYAMYSHNGCHTQEPVWYRNFLYEEERARGLDDTEDLASPGVFEWDLSAGEAVWLLTTTDSPAPSRKHDLSVNRFLDCLRENERMRRAEFFSRLHRAADAYIVNGRHGKTIMAGHPWFTAWGRDTFIALRGLCLATGRLADARDILLSWANCVSGGMLPNLFPDHGAKPKYNSVDASLWYVIAVHELPTACHGSSGIVSVKDKRAFQDAILAILDGYSKGTRFGILMDSDGLLAAGERGVQLTWINAKVGVRVPEWILGDSNQPTPPAGRKHGRNHEWSHLNNADIISMPDKWEYPWYAAWDLAFHCIPLALVDTEFAKSQLVLLTLEWYMHPNGQLFDRSAPLPTGGFINQADGTSWMAMYSLNLMRIALELAKHNMVYEDIATKFFEHFLHLAEAMNNIGDEGIGLWCDKDEFYYDVLNLPNGQSTPLKVRSMVGLIPLFAVETREPELLEQLPGFAGRLEWMLKNRPHLAKLVSRWKDRGMGERHLLSLLRGHRMKCLLRRMLDETEFLSDYGVRALSKVHEREPYRFSTNGNPMEVGYWPAESMSGLFGGNSNWRGPIWMPVNCLLIESLQKFHHYYGDDFKIECPTGSGKFMTLNEVADELSQRLAKLFLKGDDGQRPALKYHPKLATDLHFKDYVLFHEYFHGDNGRGVGAAHQTGWTGLVAKLLQPRNMSARKTTAPKRTKAFAKPRSQEPALVTA